MAGLGMNLEGGGDGGKKEGNENKIKKNKK